MYVCLCSVNSQVYKLTACSTNEALTWVENLQGKRGEFIKVRSAMEDTMLEQEKERYNLRPPSSKPMGALVPTSPVDSPLRSSPGVESIVLSKIRYIHSVYFWMGKSHDNNCLFESMGQTGPISNWVEQVEVGFDNSSMGTYTGSTPNWVDAG